MPKRKVKQDDGTTPDVAQKSPKRKATSKPDPQRPSPRSVVFAVLAPDAQSVSVVGEFNQWHIESHPLRQKEDGTWTITLQLPPGIYQYKFVIDGIRWEDDADNPNRVMNEFGTSNSILEVL
jgi:1,4-alpha-glucan branching enzyme